MENSSSDSKSNENQNILAPNMFLERFEATSSTFNFINFDHCIINQCDLSNSRFSESKLDGIAISDSNLDGSLIERCSLRGVSLQNCNVDGLVINGFKIGDLIDSLSGGKL